MDRSSVTTRVAASGNMYWQGWARIQAPKQPILSGMSNPFFERPIVNPPYEHLGTRW